MAQTQIEKTIQDIPLNKLVRWKGNVRTSHTREGIEELAASIGANGLIQNLAVQSAAKGKFVVAAGGRRLAALTLLREEKLIADDYPVPCRVYPKEMDLTEISLAENVHREDLSLVDEFDAFLRLHKAGMSASEIAMRHGVTERRVLGRLALARLAPRFIELLRADEKKLDLMMALTLTDDHKRQEEVWDRYKDQTWNLNPTAIRRALTESEIQASDKRVKFVGLEAYEAAGGKFCYDLFTEGDNGVYLTDAALLNRIADEKLEALAAQVREEGWKWVDIRTTENYSDYHRIQRVQPELGEMSAEDAALEEQLEKHIGELADEYNSLADENGDNSEKELERLNAIDSEQQDAERALEKIEAKYLRFTPEQLAMCGATVEIAHDGTPEIIRGYLRSEDKKAAEKGLATDPAGSEKTQAADTEKDETGGLSAQLLEDLTCQRTVALQAELAARPDVALRALVYTLVIQTFTHDIQSYRVGSCLQIRPEHKYMPVVEESRAAKRLEKMRKDWLKKIPHNTQAEIWDWVYSASDTLLLDLLAFCTALTLNAVVPKGLKPDTRVQQVAGAIHRAVELNMSNWYTPTAENYFSRVSKPLIVEAMNEAGKTTDSQAAGLKKGVLAALAEDAVQGTGWLPKPLRRPEAGPADESDPEDELLECAECGCSPEECDCAEEFGRDDREPNDGEEVGEEEPETQAV